MSDKNSDFDREMSRLEAEIKRLEVEYNQFFAGRLPRLPWETRARVEQLVKQYDRMNFSNTAQRFRFGTVQAKFMSFCELWERNLRAKEEGRGPRARVAARRAVFHRHRSSRRLRPWRASARRMPISRSRWARRPPRQRAPSWPPPRRRRGRPSNRTRIRDVSRDSDRVTALYDELMKARQSAGEPAMPFDRFATVVKAQLAKLGGGASDVSFRVNVSEGKVTLMAKKVDE